MAVQRSERLRVQAAGLGTAQLSLHYPFVANGSRRTMQYRELLTQPARLTSRLENHGDGVAGASARIDGPPCARCSFAGACALTGYGESALSDLQCVVELIGAFPRGSYIYHRGESFKALFTVHSGAIKTSLATRDGREHIPGFFLPGEIFGLDAISPQSYPFDAIALQPTTLCRFSFPAIAELASRRPRIQQHLFRVFSQRPRSTLLPRGNYTSEQRVAAFLVDLSERYKRRGSDAHRIHLNMTRADIASYLSIATESVSRILTHLVYSRIIRVSRRDIELLKLRALREIISTR